MTGIESCQRSIQGVVRPVSVQDVIGVVELANREGLTLYPVSTGRNIGFGGGTPFSDVALVLDLSRMRRILFYSELQGHVGLQPGVTQGQLARAFGMGSAKLPSERVECLQALKRIHDPNQIIAPGRYVPPLSPAVSQAGSALSVTRVGSATESGAASALLRHNYLAMGYLLAHGTELSRPVEGPVPDKVMPHETYSDVQVLIAKREESVVGTVSIVPDLEKGLPGDEVFLDLLQQLREANCRIAQICALAVDQTLEWRGRLQVSKSLMYGVGFAAEMIQIGGRPLSHLVMIIIPRHVDFYSQAVGFSALGDPRPVPMVQNKLGQLMCLELAKQVY
jgi:hypothetical protein